MSGAAESVFVSYAGADRAWAEWVAWHLREAGHRVELDVWDWRTGDNFVERMDQALERATAVVALFSNNYFDSARWTREEWTSVVGRRRRLVPLTVEPLHVGDVPDILAAVIRRDLHGLDEQDAITALREAVDGPTGPLAPPPFPGMAKAAAGKDAGGGRPRLPGGAGVPGVWNVPRRNPHFTGRETAMTRVREELLGGRQTVVQALHGLGGIGKTQLALEYAHRFASQYDTVWWIDAEQADQIPAHYTELAARLGIAAPGAGTDHTTRTLLDHLRTRERWLIVLDNADDPDDFENLLPAGPGHVLITSRNSGWKDLVPSHGLDVFSRSDSVAYLATRIPDIPAQQADTLAADLGDLPLALAQAAGVITTGMTPDRYRQLLTDKTAQLMANGGPPGYPAHLAATVDIATTRLTENHPRDAELLRLAAFLGPDPVPTAWLETTRGRLATLTVDPDDFMWPQTALQHLSRSGLARVDHETFQIHRLTQAIVRDHTSESDTTAAENDVTTLLAAIAPCDAVDPVHWPTWAALTSHLIARLHTSAQHPLVHQTLIQAAHYLCESGQARVGRDLTATLHSLWVTTLGEDHPHTLGIAQYLGHATINLGEYEAARRIIEDAFERRRRTLGEDHRDTLKSANDLSIALDLLGEYEEGRRMDEDTLERRRRTLGQDHPETLISANNLAGALGRLGNHEEARRLHEDTLERRRRTLGQDHPETLTSANNLAGILGRLGNHEEARRRHEDTLERRRRTLGQDHPDTLASANNLAGTLNDLGEHEEARRLHEDTLERHRRTLGQDHPETLTSANNLAGILNDLGEHEEARRLHEDTLERRRRTLGQDHPDTLTSANNVGKTLAELRRFTAAEQLLRDTHARSRRTLGDQHPRTLTSADNLAWVLTALGRPFEAQKLRASGGKAGQRRKRRKRR
ncbi:FxSxx-COOH system tetratricopeptide repeat protein [Streptomyces sp. NPDC048623]|uniref:FxSxx-COOH system tetratricopeptide repeat protein n=1 Tax=Streptomyces sp. NPDC048623 TaxID=3155761 RepID=UPI003445B567